MVLGTRAREANYFGNRLYFLFSLCFRLLSCGRQQNYLRSHVRPSPGGMGRRSIGRLACQLAAGLVLLCTDQAGLAALAPDQPRCSIEAFPEASDRVPVGPMRYPPTFLRPVASVEMECPPPPPPFPRTHRSLSTQSWSMGWLQLALRFVVCASRSTMTQFWCASTLVPMS